MFQDKEYVTNVILLYPYDKFEEKYPRKMYDSFLDELVYTYGGDFRVITTAGGDYIIRSDVVHIVLPEIMRQWLSVVDKPWWEDFWDIW